MSLGSWGTAIFCGLAFLAGLQSMAMSEDVAQPETVASIDINKYMGLWHQVAAIPAPFQGQCYSHTAAEYSLLEDGLIRVINSCTREGGERESADGRARPNPHFASNAKLEVTFVKAFDWLWALAGDYWVLELGPDYEYSVVGHPDHKYAWILSREPSLPLETLKEIRQLLHSQGYDPCRLIMSRTEQLKFDQTPTLCEYLDRSSQP